MLGFLVVVVSCLGGGCAWEVECDMSVDVKSVSDSDWLVEVA